MIRYDFTDIKPALYIYINVYHHAYTVHVHVFVIFKVRMESQNA